MKFTRLFVLGAGLAFGLELGTVRAAAAVPLPGAVEAAQTEAKSQPSATPATDAGPSRLVSFELSDQFGQLHRVEFPRARPILLLVGDRKGSEQVDAWVPWLKQQFGGKADILGLADVGGIPRIFRDRLANSIRQKRTNPVMLDFESAVTPRLGCQRQTANLFLVDAQGLIHAHLSGTTNAANVANLRAAVDKLSGAPSGKP